MIRELDSLLDFWFLQVGLSQTINGGVQDEG